MRDSTWGSALGRLYLTGRLTSSDFAAGKHWNSLVTDYSTCRSPTPPRTLQLDAVGGTPADPDSDVGAREALRHRRATAAFLDGRHALRLAGAAAERAAADVCERDCVPVGPIELEALRTGLRSLSTWWSTKRKAR